MFVPYHWRFFTGYNVLRGEREKARDCNYCKPAPCTREWTEEEIEAWEAIKPNQEIRPAVVPYKHEGSTFDQDGIRLTGSQSFIDSVLSHLKPLLQHENGTTRLQVSHSQATDRHTGEKLDSFKCYVQVHERGRQAQICNAIKGRR